MGGKASGNRVVWDLDGLGSDVDRDDMDDRSDGSREDGEDSADESDHLPEPERRFVRHNFNQNSGDQESEYMSGVEEGEEDLDARAQREFEEENAEQRIQGVEDELNNSLQPEPDRRQRVHVVRSRLIMLIILIIIMIRNNSRFKPRDIIVGSQLSHLEVTLLCAKDLIQSENVGFKSKIEMKF